MKISITLFLIVLVLTNSSCDVLNQNPKGSFTVGNFYKTKKDAIAAVNAIYSSMGGYQQYLWRNASALPSDDIRVPVYDQFERLHALSEYTFDSENSEMNGIWSSLYGSVNKANAVIKRVPDIDMNQDLKNRLLGEGHFLRGYFYFGLVKQFGKVPLILDDNLDSLQIKVASSSVDDIFNQVISDLNTAEKYLPSRYSDNSDVGRATSGAATALLARVYLWRKNWKMVAQKAYKVIKSGRYGLFDDYADNFSVTHENGKEKIFSYQFSQDRPQGFAADFGVPRAATNLINSSPAAEIVPEIGLFNLYKSDDYRRKVNFMTEYVNEKGDTVTYHDFVAGIPLIGKYYNPNLSEQTNNTLNRPIIRYSDVLLMYAEALNELDRTGEAYKYINMVRKRARNGNVSASPQDIPAGSLSKDQFRKAIYKERRLELVFEGLRRDDLVREGRLVEAMKEPGIQGGKNIKKYNKLYPKPLTQLQLNSLLEQNPGYK